MLHLIAVQPQTTSQRERPSALNKRLWTAIATALLLAVSVMFRVADLGRIPGLNADEAWSGVQAIRFLHGENVEWQTPTGNLINVFFWGPLVILHSVFPPSIALLRSVSVVSGLVAVTLAYRMSRNVFDRETAVYLTLMIACLPAAIAYSRFAWDSSQSLLVGCLVVFTSLGYARRAHLRVRGWAVLAAVLLAAVWIHPTNVFLLPFMFCCVVTVPQRFLRLRNSGLIATVLLVTAAVALNGIAQLTAFFVDLSRVFSGTTVFQFISGGASINAVHWFDVATWTFLAIACGGFWLRIRSCDSSVDLRLAWSVGLGLAAFYFVAGQKGVASHFERYALWSIVPCLLIAARGISFALPPRRHWQRPAFAAVLLISVVWLTSFYRYYFREFRTTGGRSHLAFRVSNTDLKLATLQRIAANHRQPTAIASRNWWTSLPLAYLTWSNRDIRFVPEYELLLHSAEQRKFIVELIGTDEARDALEFLRQHKLRYREFVEKDNAGEPVIIAWEIFVPESGETASNAPISRIDSELFADFRGLTWGLSYFCETCPDLATR